MDFPAELELLKHTDNVNQLLARYGVKFSIYKNNQFKEQLFPFDAIPRIIEADGYAIGNIDATIIAQKPKMSPHIPEMKRIIAEALMVEEDRINIKATTEEGLGFTGEGLGISCQAICLLETL